MVNDPTAGASAPERSLAVRYAPVEARAGLAALLTLDARLGAIVRRASDPTIGLMRLTWWADALAALDAGPPPAEPILTALAEANVPGAALAGMIDGWERLLYAEPLDVAAFGRERGGRLFVAAAAMLGGVDDRVPALGEGWALADLSLRHSDDAVAAEARALAGDRLRGVFGKAWAAPLRPLGALGLLARSDLAGGQAGSPGRVSRLLVHRLTGR